VKGEKENCLKNEKITRKNRGTTGDLSATSEISLLFW